MVWIPKHIQCWKGRERIAESRVVLGKAIYIIVLNQMSPRHISGILYEYPQFTT